MPKPEIPKSLILYDGSCGFCNKSVRLILNNERKPVFHFSPLESEMGERARKQYNVPDHLDSLILIGNNRFYYKSSAALLIAKKLRRLYPLLIVFWIVPKPIRDFFYDLIAKNRHKLASQDNCMLPAAETRERFYLK